MSFLTNIRKQILCLLTITFIFTASLLAQSGDDGEISKKGHLEAIKLIERVVDELPTHLRSDASPIIADLYNEYLTHFLGQNAAEADANTASSTLKMTGKVNKYFDDLVTLLKANGVTILDPKDLTPEMKKTIKSKLKDAVAESIEIDDNIKNLKNSKLGSGALYYIAEMTNGDLVALNIPSELDGAIKVAEGQYVITEEVFENYLGKQILESRGYAVAEGGLMVVMRSDKFTLENATPEGVRTAIEEQKKNKITSIRIRASKTLVETVSKMVGENTLVIEAAKEDIVGFKEIRLNNIAPSELKCEKWVPQSKHMLHLTNGDVMNLLETQGDQLLMYPYDSFGAVVDMMKFGAQDPNVKSLRITLYRTAAGEEAEIIQAVEDAIKNGKEVTAIIEARARGNELSNLEIYDRLNKTVERYGAANRVKLIYQAEGMKVHAKLIIFERFDGKMYAYIPTGNLHEFTAGVYTDLGKFTANQAIINDIITFVDNINNDAVAPVFTSGNVFAAPWNLRTKLESLIKEQTALGKDGKIVIKANILTDPAVIKLLKQAKEAGVEVYSIIRERSLADEELGVKSVLGPFLEHMRIYQFGKDENAKIYIASGDPSKTKLDLRYELFIEETSPDIKKELMDILAANIKDTEGSWMQTNDDEYEKIKTTDNELSFGVQNYLKSKAEKGMPEYEGADGISTLLSNCVKNGWSLTTAFNNYPKAFSTKNVLEFIRSAAKKGTKAEGLNVLTQATNMISQLKSVAPELLTLTSVIDEAVLNLDKSDMDILRGRLEEYLKTKLDNVEPEKIISDAVALLLSMNGSLEYQGSDLLAKIVFGSPERDGDDGLISLSNKFNTDQDAVALLCLLTIAQNQSINYEGQVFNTSDFFANVVGSSIIGKNMLNSVNEFISSDKYALAKTGITLDGKQIEKTLEVIDEVNNGVSLYK